MKYLRHVIVGFSFIFLLATTSVASEGRDLALGIVLGEPSGLRAQIPAGEQNALNFGLSFSFNSYVLFSADYVWPFPSALATQKTEFIRQLVPYLGFGGFMAFSSKSSGNSFLGSTTSRVGAGIRVPGGLHWKIPESPIAIFLELVPGLAIAPSTTGVIGGGIGALYYF